MTTTPPAEGATDPRDAMFDTSGIMTDLGRRTGNASIILLLMSGLKVFQQILSIALLARLIAPGEYGVFAMAMPGMMLAQALSNFGLPQAIIQRKGITHQLVSSLFWANTLFGLIAMGAVMALAWPASVYFNEPRVLQVFQVISLAVLFSAVSGQYVAIMRRMMRIREAEIITLAAEFAGIGVAVTVALLGGSYWALVFQQLTVPLVTFVALMVVTGWRPSSPRHFRLGEVTGALAFGGYVTGFSIVNRLTEYIGTVITARMLGDVATGLFFRARNLASMPQRKVMTPLSGAFVPAMSRLQDDPKALIAMFERLTTRANVIMLPIAVVLAAGAEPVTALLLGPTWSEAAPLLFWMSIFTLRSPVGSGLHFAVIACGQSRPLFHYAIVRFVLIAAVMVACVNWGLVAMTAAYMLMELLVALPMLARVAVRHTPIPLRTVLSVALPDLVLAVALAAGLIWLGPVFEGWPAALELLAILSLTGLTYGLRVLADPGLRRDVGTVAMRIAAKLGRRA